MKSHVTRILKNPRSIVFIIIISIIPFIDLLQNIFSGMDFFPAYGAFLAGSSKGHISQILLTWFLPIYLLMICADDYIQDYKTGYNHILITKIGKKKYVKEKLTTSFIFVFITMLIILLLNYILSIIFFYEGTFAFGVRPESFIGNWLGYYSRLYPNITYILYIINFSILAGFTAALGSASALIFPDYKFTYPLVFFIWFMQISGRNNAALIMQPFTETSFNQFIWIWIVNTKSDNFLKGISFKFYRRLVA